MALEKGTACARHWSRSNLPRIPWGMVRLSFRSGTKLLARSPNHVFFLASVRVTRGGGLKDVRFDTFANACRSAKHTRKSWERARTPSSFLRFGKREVFAEPTSLVTFGFETKPSLIIDSSSSSSTPSPVHGFEFATGQG